MKCRAPKPTCAHCLDRPAVARLPMMSLLNGRSRLVALCDDCEFRSRPRPGKPRLPPLDPPDEPAGGSAGAAHVLHHRLQES